MSFEDFPTTAPVVETPKLTRAEKQAILKSANINDADILEKIATICSSKAEDLPQNELDDLRKYAKEGGHQPLEWSPWVTNDKFFIEDDGSIMLGQPSV